MSKIWTTLGALLVTGLCSSGCDTPRGPGRTGPNKWKLRGGYDLERTIIVDDEGKRYEVFTTQHGLSVLPAPRAGAQGTAKKTDISNEM